MIGRVCGTGSYLPIRTVSNDELSHVMETSDEWIRERTGIRFRHVALEETTSDMAAEAAARALKNGEVNADEIELILFGCDLSIGCVYCSKENRRPERVGI